jgi:FlaG/FlaF family flagellin (archaellin)
MCTNIREKLTGDNRGMSTVVGAILVVGITVVLAAIIGGFVFGIGDDLSNTQPQAQIEFTYDQTNDELVIVHDGGETINNENTGSLELAGDIPSDMQDSYNYTDSASSVTELDGGKNSGDVIISSESSADAENGVGYLGAGSAGVSDLEGGDTVQLVWVSNDGSQSNQLGKFVVPQN